MTTAAFRNDYRIIDLTWNDYYVEEEEKRPRTFSVMNHARIFIVLGLFSSLFINLFRSVDPVMVPFHATLTIDCYLIQLSYYSYEVAVNLITYLLFGT